MKKRNIASLVICVQLIKYKYKNNVIIWNLQAANRYTILNSIFIINHSIDLCEEEKKHWNMLWNRVFKLSCKLKRAFCCNVYSFQSIFFFLVLYTYQTLFFHLQMRFHLKSNNSAYLKWRKISHNLKRFKKKKINNNNSSSRNPKLFW